MSTVREVCEEDSAAELANEVDDEEDPCSLLRMVMENLIARDEQVNNGFGFPFEYLKQVSGVPGISDLG
jgi:hypothetical protein